MKRSSYLTISLLFMASSLFGRISQPKIKRWMEEDTSTWTSQKVKEINKYIKDNEKGNKSLLAPLSKKIKEWKPVDNNRIAPTTTKASPVAPTQPIPPKVSPAKTTQPTPPPVPTTIPKKKKVGPTPPTRWESLPENERTGTPPDRVSQSSTPAGQSTPPNGPAPKRTTGVTASSPDRPSAAFTSSDLESAKARLQKTGEVSHPQKDAPVKEETLIDQIRKGKTLRKVSPTQKDAPVKGKELTDVLSESDALAKAVAKRRGSIEGHDSDEEEWED